MKIVLGVAGVLLMVFGSFLALGGGDPRQPLAGLTVFSIGQTVWFCAIGFFKGAGEE